MRVPDLQTQASLIVASFDLKLVQLLRQAIRTADLSGGKVGRDLACDTFGNGCCEPRQHIHPEPRYEPRPVLHPTPRYEPREVRRPTHYLPACPPPAPDCCEKTAKSDTNCGPLPPPWRMPVSKNSLQTAPLVKVFIHRTDVHNKGSLIDVFL